MTRTAIYLFHERSGVVDDYVPQVIASLRPFINHCLVVVNGPLTDKGRRILTEVADDVLQRENDGMDVGGYHAGLTHLGWETVATLDELILLNNTFVGPVRPWEPVFAAAAARPDASLWGLTEHAEMRPHPFLSQAVMPRHLQSHFLVFRSRLLVDPAFRHYWETMPPIRNYNDSVAHHESRLTDYWRERGHESFAVFPLEDFSSEEPALTQPLALLEAGCPALKRRVFFHDPRYLDAHGVDGAALIRALSGGEVSEHTLVQSLTPLTCARTLLTNLGLTEILHGLPADGAAASRLNIHALVHTCSQGQRVLQDVATAAGDPRLTLWAASEDLADGLRQCLASASDDENKTVCSDENPAHLGADVDIRVARYPQAGVLCAWLLDSCRDGGTDSNDNVPVLLLGSHEKQAENDPLGCPTLWPEAVDLMGNHLGLGVLVAAASVHGSTALSHGWPVLRESVVHVAQKWNLDVRLDEDAPVWSYGRSMLVRPQALASLREDDISNLISNYGQAVTGLILDCLVVPTALTHRYHCRQVLDEVSARRYAMVEYRYLSLARHLPAALASQEAYLAAHCGSQASAGAVIRRTLEQRAPKLARRLTPLYRRLRVRRR